VVDGGSEGSGWAIVEEGGWEERTVGRERLSGREDFWRVGGEGGRVG